ncbi:MAG: carboxypeptidase regulatory-like domain-containing protein [Candidatus Caldatribacterium sp.]|nr:carboxypeptidase regulatory-like domain-containing protein [Candidatus Caldatribacterium sp.]
MVRRDLFLLLILSGLLGLVVLSGCFAPAQFGSPERTIIRGTVAMPEGNRCFAVTCAQPQASEDHVPIPQADVTLYGENGDLLMVETDDCGTYEVAGAKDSCYILYAQVPGGSARVKKGFTVEGGKVNNVGEANVYTTAQVIIYEVAVERYGKEVVRCSDIPNFVPTPALLEAVRNALLRCHDPQKDCNVLTLARSVAASYFGAPGGVAGGGTPGGETGGGGGDTGGGGEAGGGGGDTGGGSQVTGSITVRLYCNNPCCGGSCNVDDEPPVSGATVTTKVNGEDKTFIESENEGGTYTLDNLPVGEYTITIDAQGFKSPESVTVEIIEDDPNPELEIGLLPEPPSSLALADTSYDGPTSGTITIDETVEGSCWHFTVSSGNWSSEAYCGQPNAVSYINEDYTIADVEVAPPAVNRLLNQEGAFDANGVLNPDYMAAIWILLGYDSSNIGCVQSLYTENAQSLAGGAQAAVQNGWYPCPGDKVGVIIKVSDSQGSQGSPPEGQDVLVIAESNWNPCPPLNEPQAM